LTAALVIGALAGLYPAARAARQSPSAALRTT
jgi:ABC-type lipoprotein release transport system permease subunit